MRRGVKRREGMKGAQGSGRDYRLCGGDGLTEKGRRERRDRKRQAILKKKDS